MELKEIDMKDIVRNPKQPRQSFDHEKIIELSNSIKEGDLLQPITVRPMKTERLISAATEITHKAEAYDVIKQILPDTIQSEMNRIRTSPNVKKITAARNELNRFLPEGKADKDKDNKK